MLINRRSFLASAGAALAFRQSQTSTSTAVERDVVFGQGGGMDLHCDIYRPPASAPAKRTAIIHYHGGGFARGSKEALAEKLPRYTKRGYVSIAAQYRLSGVAKWPAQIEDVKACIRWTRANADRLGIDPAKIAIAGYSAGGLLALFASGTQDRPEFEGTGGSPGVSTKLAACFSFYAVTGPSWSGWRTSGLLPNGADDAAFSATEPANYVKDFPPTEIFHGTADVTVPIESSQKLFEALRQAKVPVEMHEFDGVPHEFDEHPEFGETVAQLADFFLDRHVLNPRTYPPFSPGGPRR